MPTALLLVNDALRKRGLTQGMATCTAGPEHGNVASQCMYVLPDSAPELSYDDALCAVDLGARMECWEGCGQYCINGMLAQLLAGCKCFARLIPTCPQPIAAVLTLS